MFTIFVRHVRSVTIIYLSFLPLIIRTTACFTVKQSFSRLNSKPKDAMSKEQKMPCRMKILPMHITLKEGVNEATK